MVGNYTPDPVLSMIATAHGLSSPGNVLEDNMIATTPGAPSSVNGISGTSGASGSSTSPIVTSSTTFEANFLDETELYEYPNYATTGRNPGGSPGAYDTSQTSTVLPYLPSGTVAHADGSSSTGAGLPYVAILSPDLSKVLATEPVTVAAQDYTPSPAAWMPAGNGANQPSTTNPCKLLTTLSFNVSDLYANGTLTVGSEYAAYLLVRDTDVSGPLSNHLWYFQNSSVPAATALTTDLNLYNPNAAAGAVTAEPGTSVSDLGVLTGSNVAQASGSLTFTVYSDSACTQPVASGGTVQVAYSAVSNAAFAFSGPVVLTTPGTYYWQARYSGDGANAPSTSACGEEVETVQATPSPGPYCAITGLSLNSPASGQATYSVTVQDPEYGLQSVSVVPGSESGITAVQVPSVTVGSKAPVGASFTATIGQYFSITLTVTNTNGQTTTCDPEGVQF